VDKFGTGIKRPDDRNMTIALEVADSVASRGRSGRQ
jgi:hypothetical protein